MDGLLSEEEEEGWLESVNFLCVGGVWKEDKDGSGWFLTTRVVADRYTGLLVTLEVIRKGILSSPEDPSPVQGVEWVRSGQS